MNKRPQQVNSSNESSVAHHHYPNSPRQEDDFPAIAGMSALQHRGSSLHYGVGGGLPQDTMSNIFSPNQDLLMRSSRQGPMGHHLPMAMGGGSPMSMGGGGSNSLQSNSLLGNHPELQCLPGVGGSVGGQEGPNGRSDMSDADLLSHDQLVSLQRRLQQQQSRLLYGTMGSTASRNSQAFSSARDTFSSMNMNNISSHRSPGGHLDSVLHRQNEDPSFLLNRNVNEEKNQLLQQMNFQLHLQEQELALRKSQLERAGLSSMSVASLGMGQSYPNPMGSAGPVRDHVVPQQQQQQQQQLENNQEVLGRSELIFANSSIQGIAASRSTSVETTPSGKVFYFPCRARGMEQGHNFESAYFTVPEGLDHGADLYCSYRACRAEGCKFRYCATCKAPAARRNFRKRHGHEETKPKNKVVPVKKTTPTSTTAETSEKVMQKVFQDAGAETTPPTTPSPDNSANTTPAPKQGSKVRPRSGSDDEEMGSDELNECWDNLLTSRPDVSDKSGIEAWMLRVTALSARMHRQKSRKSCDSDNSDGGICSIIMK